MPKVRRARILLVDDDELVGTSVQRMLLRDYDVTYFSDPSVALGRLREGERWDWVFSDVSMRRMSGIELREAVRSVVPELANRFVFLTGGAAAAEEQLKSASVACTVLEKPIDLDRIRRLLGGPLPVLEP